MSNLKLMIKKTFLEPLFHNLHKIKKMHKLKASKEEWAAKAQKGEFAFHKGNKWRNSPRFMEDTTLLFESFGFDRDEYAGKVVMDIGAGSKLRGKFFRDSKLVAIEPMADDCVKEIPWTDLTDAYKLYSLPAEDRIEEMADHCDLIFSINVLDHCFDFEKIVENVYSYLKPGGLAFLSFDEHFVTDSMHPLILTDDICLGVYEKVGFKLIKKSKGFDGAYKAKKNITTYGHGIFCLNYWLTKE